MGYQGLEPKINSGFEVHPCNGVIMGHPVDGVLVGAGSAFGSTLVGLQVASLQLSVQWTWPTM
jgi:hypothetical protein